MIPDVTHFKILADHEIEVTLANGKRDIFDVKPYLNRGIFTELKNYDYFKRAGIEFGTLTWPNEQDFSPKLLKIKMRKV
jgi:hypothetical protein